MYIFLVLYVFSQEDEGRAAQPPPLGKRNGGNRLQPNPPDTAGGDSE